MAEFLTTQGTSYHIENIIRDAKTTLVLISPYLQLSKIQFDRLRDADKRNVQIILVYGKEQDKLRLEDREQLRQLGNLGLYFLENLHAKCYFNEEYMVITSMNLYQFSEKNNREMGVLIRLSTDKEVFEAALKEAQSIVKASRQQELQAKRSQQEAGTARDVKDAPVKLFLREMIARIHSSAQQRPKTPRTVGTDDYRSGATQRGYCIRCGKRIPHNVEHPHCDDCYSEWAIYGNYDYEEGYCHTCGKPEPTTRDKPQCYPCYMKTRR